MEDFTAALIMLIGGFLIRFSLITSGQIWAKSYSQTVAFFILPIITYVITKTIYGNIALSLGMIGALSIVRFRHPVKSALELIIYFDLITIGIAASVKDKYAIGLITATVLIILILNFTQKSFKKNNKSFYNLSFSEGIDFDEIEILSNSKLDKIENSEHLKSSIFEKESNQYTYRLSFESRDQLNNFKKEIEENDQIKKIDVTYI
tara:strand:- start:981 stop:1598 length:618 start_codon:yes stop_codon:yes gene_type:complete